jgi:DNA-binding SARP family transcriptional activator
VRFSLLGPLELKEDDHVFPLGTPKQKAVLATLLVRVNALVSVDELIDELWGARAPKSAPDNVRLYVANLRRLLAVAKDAAVISRHGRSYRLNADPDNFDFVQFRAKVAVGRRASADGDWEASLPLFERSVGLWRGRALADVPMRVVLSEWCAAAEAEWLSASEDLIEALINTGLPDRAASHAGDLLAIDPLRERAHRLLMLAQYQAGNVAGALRAFHSARNHMVEQLGVEPGSDLRRLHSAMLSRDPDLPIDGPPTTPGRTSDRQH